MVLIMNEADAFSKLFRAYQDEMGKQTDQLMGTAKNMKAAGHELDPQTFSVMYSTAAAVSVLRAVSKLYPPAD